MPKQTKTDWEAFYRREVDAPATMDASAEPLPFKETFFGKAKLSEVGFGMIMLLLLPPSGLFILGCLAEGLGYLDKHLHWNGFY